jgi:DNA-binding NarL/FixJ family response regulator
MKRVFMLSRQPLFSQGIEKLLRQRPGFEIIGREANAHQAVNCIQALAPDIVILDSQDLASTPADVVAAVLRAAPGARLISLNLENDQIMVYHGERRTARSIDDLCEAMSEDPTQPAENLPPSAVAA